MASCDNIKYNSLSWCEGDTQLPGIRPAVYAIAKRDIVTWPTLPETTSTTQAALATYTGSFTLAALAKWQKVGIITDKSPVNFKSQGSKPSKTFLNNGTFMHQGVEEEASGFARQANNDDLVYAFQVKKGKWRILGNEMYPTNTDIEQSLGSDATSEMGTKLDVTVTDECPAPFYTGELDTIDGMINPQTP